MIMSTGFELIAKKLEIKQDQISVVVGGLIMFFLAVMVFSYYSTLANSAQFKAAKPTQTETLVQENDSLTALSEAEQTTKPGQVSSTSVTRYQVQPGDSLWSIAEDKLDDGYSWVEIQTVNNLDNPDLLSVGSWLDLPNTARPQEPDPIALKASELALQEHTVVQGESLWTIALTYYQDGMFWNQIWQANKDTITNPNQIDSGQVLTLPPPNLAKAPAV